MPLPRLLVVALLDVVVRCFLRNPQELCEFPVSNAGANRTGARRGCRRRRTSSKERIEMRRRERRNRRRKG
eukprot:761575-Hanusia_phi.AAC.3